MVRKVKMVPTGNVGLAVPMEFQPVISIYMSIALGRVMS
jgi:hypothetical protein